MNKSKLSVLIFVITLLISFAVFLYTKRDNPILFQQPETFLIQNPFRDKTKEKAAESFLNSIKGKEIINSFAEIKDVVYKHRPDEFEVGKLADWTLWSRFDDKNETEFYYAIYREDDFKKPKKGKYFMSFVTLKLTGENSEWKVKEYNCKGISWNDW